MRIALLADTHMPRGPRALPPRCVEEIAASDLLIHAGDFSTAAILEQLRRIGPPVRAVHGNVDDAELRSRLPERTEVAAGGALIGLVHDAGPSRGRLARLRRWFPAVEAVVFGHSHLPLHERDGGFQIFNPGSPTDRRRAPRRSMGVAIVAGGELRFEHLAL